MSMLAEPRRRKRYHLNPRGKALYEDDSRFGTKMLEKMGWSKGKGLGANESGSLDFVRVQFKDNSEGLGYADTNRDDQWTAHEESFNGLLKNLNGNADGEPNSNNINNASDDASEDEHRPIGFGFKTDEVKAEKKKTKLKEKISGISLEEKSKSSKARVHYKKFTRGKDLSRYSEKDLANIFGKKAVDDEVDDIYQQLNKSMGLEKSKPEEKEVNADFGGVQTVSTGLSVADYFKQKMEAIRNKNKNATQTIEPEHQPLVNDSDENEEPSTKKSKKKKKLILNEQNEQNLLVEDDQPLVNDESKSKSKKNNKLILNEQNAVVKEKITMKRQKRETECNLPKPAENEEPSEETEPKRKKKTKNNVNAEMEPLIERNDESIEESTKIVKKKNKKAKKMELSENVDLKKVNSIEVETTVPTVQLEEKVIQNTLKKKKKSKKNKEIANEEIQVETKLLEESNQLPSVEVTSNKKKKKSKKQSKPEKEFEVKPDDDVSVLLPDQEQDLIDKSSNEDSDTQQQEELLSIEQLLEKRDSFNVYQISTFTAEKFRNFNLNAFRGSTISEITGYSCNDINLKVIQSKGDEKRILKLWSNQTTKYGKSSNHTFNKTHYQVLRTTTKRKTVRTHLNAIKRRSAFTII